MFRTAPRRLLTCLALATSLAPRPAAGTVRVGAPFLVMDLAPGSGSGTPTNLVSLGDRVIFSANDGVHGTELWTSDGTPAGTHLVTDLWPGTTGGFNLPSGAQAVSGVGYFAAQTGIGGSQLWRTDGTAAGTFMVQHTGAVFGFANVPGPLYFAGTPVGGGQAFLYRSDGTDLGTQRVASNVFLTGSDLTEGPGGVWFPADDGNHGAELWRSDGTSGGTSMVKDLVVGASGAEIGGLTRVGSLMFCFGRDDVSFGVIRSDGTAAGTFKVASFRSDPAPGSGRSIVGLNGIAYFIADDDVHGDELWRSDGTIAGTFMLTDLWPGPTGGLDYSELCTFGNRVYFTGADPAHGQELWSTDGTLAGTAVLADLNPGPGYSAPYALNVINGLLFFTDNPANAIGNSTGYEPWITDGTVAGTRAIGDVRTDSGNSTATGYTYANGYVFFSAMDFPNGRELWAAPMTGVADAGTSPPRAVGMTLAQNAPNPFRVTSEIVFTLARAERVSLAVFDIGGREVLRLADGVAAAGRHRVTLNASGLPSGVYLYRLRTERGVLEKRALHVR